MLPSYTFNHLTFIPHSVWLCVLGKKSPKRLHSKTLARSPKANLLRRLMVCGVLAWLVASFPAGAEPGPHRDAREIPARAGMTPKPNLPGRELPRNGKTSGGYEAKAPKNTYPCAVYGDALQKTLWMLDASRAGKITEGVTLPDGTPIPNRIAWRGDSYLSDGNTLNTALAPDPDTRPGRARSDGTPLLDGGWFDAGDPPKWMPGMANAAVMLAWGGIEYPDGYARSGEVKYLKSNLKWINDYFLKAFRYDPTNPNDVSKYRLYAVVGGSAGPNTGPNRYKGVPLAERPENTLNEQEYLSTPHEVAELTLKSARSADYKRPVYFADKDAPATATVARVAAAMAAASVVFRDGTNNAYADELLEKAKMLFAFSNTYIGGGYLKNRNGDLVDSDFAGGYWDGKQFRFWQNTIHRCWAALWLHAAELKKNPNYASSLPANQDFLSRALKLTDNSVPENRFPPLFEDGSRGTFYVQARDDWGKPGKFYNPETLCYLLMGRFVSPDRVVPHTESNGSSDGTTFGRLLTIIADGTVQTTFSASGMPNGWSTHLTLGNMQPSALALFIYADKVAAANDPSKPAYVKFAQDILDYTLGSNPANRTYMTGINVPGKTPSPNWVLHGPTQGFWDGWPGVCDLDYNNTPPRHVMYGGVTSPSYDGSFKPQDYSGNNHEIGPNYQVGITGSLARMLEAGSCNAALPAFAPTETPDGKEYYVKLTSTNCQDKSLRVNATVVNHSAWPARNRNDMAFRYYFSAAPDAIVQATITTDTNVADFGTTTYTSPGARVSRPVPVGKNMYYVEVSFPNVNIFPGGRARPFGQPLVPNYEKQACFTLTSTAAWTKDEATNIAVYDRSTLLIRHSIAGPTCGVVPCTAPVVVPAAWKNIEECASANFGFTAKGKDEAVPLVNVRTNAGTSLQIPSGGTVQLSGLLPEAAPYSLRVETFTYGTTVTADGKSVADATQVVSPAQVAAFLSGIRGPFTVVSETQGGGVTYVFTPFRDQNANGTMDASECKGNPITVRVLVGTGLPTATESLSRFEGTVSVSPNPTLGEVAIEVNLFTVRPVGLTLTDALGRVLWRRRLPMAIAHRSQLDLAPYAVGVYCLTVEAGGGLVTRRIVKR